MSHEYQEMVIVSVERDADRFAGVRCEHSVEHRMRFVVLVGVRYANLDAAHRLREFYRRLEARPPGGDAGIHDQEIALAANAENAFQSGAIHPAGRSGVPRPPAPSDM